MGEPRQVREAFNAADEFLDPILKREEIQKSRGSSLLEILGRNLHVDIADDASTRAVVIGKALDILLHIHAGFVTPVKDASELVQTDEGTQDAALEDAKRRRMLHALLDLISLEGIYPSLSAGVGIPLQQRVISVLPAGVIAKQQSNASSKDKPRDEVLLDRILATLSDIILDVRPSIQPVIRVRILSDIISGSSDLAFNSTMISTGKKNHYQNVFDRVIEETPSPVLLSTLSTFLQPDPATWFKGIISGQLSRVPLRQDGVLQTILFIASQFAPSLGQEAQTQASNGPHFTVQAIMQISRLLSSVPQEMNPTVYFSTIAPQLLALIDGDDIDLRKTASYVVGNGILGKRAYGATGTIGHSIFVDPIFKTLTASLDGPSKTWIRTSDAKNGDSQGTILVDQALVCLAVDRLRSLALQHPNPGLVKRLVYPVLLPLWGLACYTLEQQRNILHEKVMALLQTYFGISVGAQPLKKLVDNLLWDGGHTWTYSLGEQDGVLLKKRDTTNTNQFNLVQLMDSLQSRAELFVGLLGSDPSSEERTGDIFLYVSETWLANPSDDGRSFSQLQFPPEKENSSDAIFQKLVSAKLAEKLLDNFRDTLSRRPLRVLELIKHLIDGELNRATTQRKCSGRQRTGGVSLSSLANIVPSEGTEQAEASAEDSTESLSTVFSLLSTVLASPEFTASQEIHPILGDIKSQLDNLIPYLPSSLSKPGTTATMLLDIHITSTDETTPEKIPTHISDLETHRQALTNLNSDLPPVQAEGFSLLSNLIMKSSPVLDIPSTLTLLLTIITDTSEAMSNEEFIYLNAIKLVGTLASRHPRTVVKTLVERYTDKNESINLDKRLKIGESLLRTVQDLGEALTGETAKTLGDGMVTVAGRRGHKPQAQEARKQQIEKERRQEEREDHQKKKDEISLPPGFNISTPASSSEPGAGIEDDDSETESPEQAANAANIFAAWAAGAASDEEPDDLRVRASAISILASAVQTNIAGLGPSVTSSAVDLALSTLTLEPAPESAIIRRASVVLLLDILKALDTARETRGTDLGFGFSLTDDASWGSNTNNTNIRGPTTIGNLPYMLRALHFVESRETDTIVRGHIRVLIESLEAWVEKSLLWGIGVHGEHGEEKEPQLELGYRIAGLSVDPMAGKDGGGRPKIEEIE
ncbi:hypothetical protein ASPWEDRAFT_50777 [Aspergillus wentii DTO 134E9]|uniref:Protein required for cell viability n=1 Tax=Aspergillus wentii DTO 134E9 TaxID=1073089 RepID=A0A1L9RS57_ASPWE|nr:uncharacterized protein ASPWEDRAFT_50777 [Aspergillus wentii DTO 134E9]OJJ37667.1 hypothetical protein ASPWEDRAFT_50777 [Aspergillus wentii DTO 134E9]